MYTLKSTNPPLYNQSSPVYLFIIFVTPLSCLRAAISVCFPSEKGVYTTQSPLVNSPLLSAYFNNTRRGGTSTASQPHNPLLEALFSNHSCDVGTELGHRKTLEAVGCREVRWERRAHLLSPACLIVRNRPPLAL